MKALLHHTYGSPDVLEFADVPEPEVGEDDVLIRVHAAAVNPLDWHFMTGTPYVIRVIAGLRRPKHPIRGIDVAGTVEAVGNAVTHFCPGDRVFGGAEGSFAELATSTEKTLAHMPDGLGFDEAAAIPIAALTALQALRDHAEVQAGQSVLINGAAGGVGTYAVQIAKVMGATVTGVTSARNVELVRSLGADQVVDYTSDDFTAGESRYDVIIDNVANRSLPELRRALAPAGIIVMVTVDKSGKWIGPLLHPIKAKLRTLLSPQRVASFTAKETKEDLEVLANMVRAGQLRSVIDRTYPLSDAADAVRYLAKGHARGKIIVAVNRAIETADEA